MIPAGFDYHAPRSVADAVKLLGSLGPDAKLLAGGHSLLPMMKLRFAQPSALIDLGKIPDLRGITQSGGEIRIGAMTTEHELLNSKLLADKVPLLVEGVSQIADPQVRYKGTIGGDICHGDPANDHPALALALDASFVLAGPKGERVVKAEGFFVGVYATLGVFLINAAREPLANRSLIWFTIWSSIVHGGIMLVQALVDETDRINLLGDVPALFLVAFVLWYLMSGKARA